MTWIETTVSDVGYGMRTLRRSPGFALVAILTLALGIGATTSMFSVVHGLLLRPLPFKDPSRLVAVLDTRDAQGGGDWLSVSPARFEEWSRRNTVFENIAALRNCMWGAVDRSARRLITGVCGSGEFLSMLGVEPILGRALTSDDDQPGRDHVALLSYGFWQRQYGGDPGVIGGTIRRSVGEPYTIVGVLPSDFRFAREDFDVWAPWEAEFNARYVNEHHLLVFARLKDGVTLRRAQAAMEVVARQLAREFPQSAGWGISVQPLQGFYSNIRNSRTTLLLLFASVGVLLLIACANIANLVLARATTRRRELAVRLGLGATRRRVVHQLITENLLLGLLGGGAGYLLTRLVHQSLLLAMPYIPQFRADTIPIDTTVFVFAMAASVAATAVFGLMPALRVSRLDVNTWLRDAGRGVHGGRRDWLVRNVLVGSEIALAMVLLVGAGLLLESFRNLRSDRVGFNPARVLTVTLCCLDEGVVNAEGAAFYRRIFERIRAVPGVEGASAISLLPMRQLGGTTLPFLIRGRVTESRELPAADVLRVEPQYFSVMQVPIRHGRGFGDEDTDRTESVALVNERLARQLWPGNDPIGQYVRPASGEGSDRWHRIVGVVADVKHLGYGTETRPTIYLNYYQNPENFAFFLVRTRTDPRSLAEPVKAAIASVNGDIPLDNVRPLEAAMTESVSTQRFSMFLLAAFGALAITLAIVGVYGVTAYTVAQRSQEFGVRLALGARSGDLLKLVLGEGLQVSATAMAIGLLGGIVLERLMASLLYGVGAISPLTFAAVTVLLGSASMLAGYVPAWRAARADPLATLREP